MMPLRAAGLLVPVLAVLVFAVPAQAARPPAAGAPGARHTWAPADKHAFGTAHQLAGHAYFTLRQASLSEIYYPDLSTPAFRGLQFAVTDGRTFVDRETVDDDPRHIEPVAPGVTATVTPLDRTLAFRQVTENARWRLTKTWISDPARDSVLLRVRFEAKTRTALRLFVLADGAPGNDGNDDRGISGESTMVAYDDKAASAVAASPALAQTSSGYRGTASDPWRDLQDYTLERTDATQAGNVVQGARAALDGKDNQTMTLAIGFGRDASAATAAATGSLGGGFDAAKAAYDSGWSSYLATLKAPPAPVAGDVHMKRLYEQSLLVLAALEDKTHRGASIAAPNMPWIWGTLSLADDKETSDPYHLVWPRDFYHAATAQKAAGDDAGASRLVDYLWRVQRTDGAEAGSFWQNTRVDGTPVWKSQQLDETALPVVLAWWLGRTASTDWDNIRAAADYLMRNGPRTGQERWENQDGYSPNTIATEIAALVCAADVARKNGDTGRAAAYEARADEWQAKVESWTATTNGPYSPTPYYLRVTKDGNPDNGFKYTLGDNFPRQVDQREIVDNSFLGPGAVRRQAPRRHHDPQLAEGRRRDERGAADREHEERPVLAPLHLRRLRRAGGRPRLGPVLRQPGPADVRARVAAAGGRARRVRADRRQGRERAAAGDRGRGQRRADAARAGLGGPRAGRGQRRGHALRDPAGVDARAVRAARLVDPGGRADRAALDRRLPLPEAALRAKGLSARGPTRPGTPRPGSPPGSRGTRRGRSARPGVPRAAGAGRRP